MSITFRSKAVAATLPESPKARKKNKTKDPQVVELMKQLDANPEIWHVVGNIIADNTNQVHRERQRIEYEFNGGKRENRKYTIALRAYTSDEIAPKNQLKVVYAKRNQT